MADTNVDQCATVAPVQQSVEWEFARRVGFANQRAGIVLHGNPLSGTLSTRRAR